MIDVVYIHRGRNKRSTEIGQLFTRVDYNFDYRGKSTFLLLLKAAITATEIPRAKVYFVEGGLCQNVASLLKMTKARDAKIILMVCEPLFHLDNVPSWKQKYLRWMLSKVDGLIAICDMIKEDAKKLYAGPTAIAHRYIIDIERFLHIKADISAKRIIYVIERPTETGYIKGLDVMIEAFKIVKKKEPKAELLIIGAGTEYLRYNVKGVRCLGFQKPEDVYTQCSVVVAPARYDAFPYAIAEGCCAGMIPLVSKNVGAKEYVAKVDPSLVIGSVDPQEYAEKILEIWNTPKEKLQAMSAVAKKEASKLNKEQCTHEFRAAWKKLVKS